MPNEFIQKNIIDELVSTDAGQKIKQTLETIFSLQKGLYALANNEDDTQLDILKIGTVFQIFFLDTLASGKKPDDLSDEDWKEIAGKVYKYAVMEEGQTYSEFVFTLYADYIDISIDTLRGKIREENLTSIKDVSAAIRQNKDRLKSGEINETSYIEACLWLSLEAMIKLLSTTFTLGLPQEYADLVISASQLAFEYGRYVLYKKEQAILEKYIENQHILDGQLQREYEEYLEEVRIQSNKFQQLVDNAFSIDIHQALEQSVALAREAGVEEEELLTSLEDVDDFFM